MWWLVAHAVHLSLLVLGTIGVVMLLFPQWREAHHRRSTVPAYRAPTSADEHRQRVEDLRASVRSGQLVAQAPPQPDPAERLRRDPSMWRVVAVVSGLAAAGVHAEVSPDHLEESVLLGVFFCTLAVAQLGWAVLLAWRISRPLLWLGIAMNVAVVALWAVTRTLGLPFGLIPGPEEVGGWDLASVFWELCTVGACVVGLRRYEPGSRTLVMGQLRAGGWAWVASSAAVLTLLALVVPVE